MVLSPEEPKGPPPPEMLLGRMLAGFMESQALHVAARLAIGDVLRDGPTTSGAIADAVGAHEPSLRRLLRFLTAMGVLTEDGEGRFAASPLGELLRSDHPRSLRTAALLMGAPFIWRPWGELYETTVSGQPAFDRVYGEPFFAYLGHSPEDAAVFNELMTSTTSLPATLSAFDFSGFTKVVDVGGGQGTLLRGVLERYPHATGVLFDLPSVVADAHELKDPAVSARCEIVGGDMFEALPPGGDVYVLKRIVHDWSDAEAIKILRNCRQVISEQGRILLIERIMHLNDSSPDLMMLILVTGRERTEDEFRELYAAAGFKVDRIIPAGEHSIIEGVPA